MDITFYLNTAKRRKKINNAGENPINGLNFFRGPVSMAEKLLKYFGFTWENF